MLPGPRGSNSQGFDLNWRNRQEFAKKEGRMSPDCTGRPKFQIARGVLGQATLSFPPPPPTCNDAGLSIPRRVEWSAKLKHE